MRRQSTRPSDRTAPLPGHGAPRGITPTDVDRAADALLRDGQRPTIEKVRARIGSGSPNTINPLLDAWWSRLAGRLDSGPAALHRLPEPVAHAAEGLWLQALAEARRRAAIDATSTRGALARERQELAVQSQILGLRESELAARLQDRDQQIARLQIEIEALTTLLRKEQAIRRHGEQHTSTSRRAKTVLQHFRSMPARSRRGRDPLPPAAADGPTKQRPRTAPRKKSRISTTNSTRKAQVMRRKLTPSRSRRH